MAIREELAQQLEDTKVSARQTSEALAETQVRLEARLTRLEDRYLDGDLSQERYLVRRDEILAKLQELRAQLPEQPRQVLPDIDQVFSIAESITLDTLDDQAWRDIIEAMLDRVTIEGSGDGRKNPPEIKVLWKPEYEPLIAMAEIAK